MATNKPEVVSWGIFYKGVMQDFGYNEEAAKAAAELDFHGYTLSIEPLIRLSDYEALRTRKPHNPKLRAAIIAEMNRGEEAGEMPFGYCTKWFKFKLLAWTTPTIRKELERMERDGLVTADRSESNNTKWRLVEHGNQ